MKTLLSFALLLTLSLSSSLAKSKTSSTSNGALQGKLTQYLKDHIKTISVTGDVAVLKSDGSLTQTNGSKTIVLKNSGDKFYASYGKKSKQYTEATFSLIKVKKKHVQLNYRATETKDGKSFKDQGEIILDAK